MSEAELQAPLPVGFLYDAQGQVMLDPDQQVQQSIRFLFESFRRLGSAGAVVKAFREGKLLFPHRPRGGPQDGELVWVKLSISGTWPRSMGCWMNIPMRPLPTS